MHFTVVPQLDVCLYPAVQVLDLIFNKGQWQVINFYHNILNSSLLNNHLGLNINAIIPMLVIRDFNAHS